MPQMNRGGKFIFGKSLIRRDGSLLLPPSVVEEYAIGSEKFVYLFTDSKSTGGFCVTRRALLEPSPLGHILAENPALRDRQIPVGEWVAYKGRSYCWLFVSPEGRLVLTPSMLQDLQLAPGMTLLCIRSSNIAFTIGAKGPLLERERRYRGEIEVY